MREIYLRGNGIIGSIMLAGGCRNVENETLGALLGTTPAGV